jgi:hypothetical protein
MKGTLERPPRRKVSWLRVLWAGGPAEEGEDLDHRDDRPDRGEPDTKETERFWAGRTLAMRRSARVAA